MSLLPLTSSPHKPAWCWAALQLLVGLQLLRIRSRSNNLLDASSETRLPSLWKVYSSRLTSDDASIRPVTSGEQRISHSSLHSHVQVDEQSSRLDSLFDWQLAHYWLWFISHISSLHTKANIWPRKSGKLFQLIWIIQSVSDMSGHPCVVCCLAGLTGLLLCFLS